MHFQVVFEAFRRPAPSKCVKFWLWVCVWPSEQVVFLFAWPQRDKYFQPLLIRRVWQWNFVCGGQLECHVKGYPRDKGPAIRLNWDASLGVYLWLSRGEKIPQWGGQGSGELLSYHRKLNMTTRCFFQCFSSFFAQYLFLCGGFCFAFGFHVLFCVAGIHCLL